MSILGLVMVLCYFPLLVMSLTGKRARWYALNAAIIVALFTNVGTVIASITYSDYAMYMLLLICLIEALKGKKVKINKKCATAGIVLLSVVGIGIMYLLSPIPKPEVLLMQTNMDQAYAGQSYTEEARFTYANIDAIKKILVFVVVLVLCREYLALEQYATRLILNVYRAYIVFFCFASIEFLVNNLISPTMIRDGVLRIIGSYDPAKTFYPRNRFGYYGFMGLYSEESYIAMMLPFFGIVYASGMKNPKEMMVFLWGSIILLMSGCTTGLMLFLFPLIILVKLLIQKIPKGQRNAKQSWVKLIVIWCGVIGLGIVIIQREFVMEVVSNTVKKVQTMIVGAQYVNTNEILSANIRNYGNAIALNAFKASPLLGVGIGTTRGYGVITGFLATFGILGIASYVYFFHSLIGLRIKKKKMLMVIYLGYMSAVLSVNYVYSIMMVPIFLLFRKQSKEIIGR